MHRPESLVTDMEVHEYIQNETGMDRLKDMWNYGTKPGTLSTELEPIFSAVKFTCYGSFLLGSFVGARNAGDEFVRKNKHTKWPTKSRASRKYLDAAFLGGVKYGAGMALHCGAFCALYLSTVLSVSVYRNKTSVWEHVAAGSLTGAVLRINMGLQGMIAAGLVGMVLGASAGILMVGTASLSGETQDIVHYRKIKALLEGDRAYHIPVPAEEAFNSESITS